MKIEIDLTPEEGARLARFLTYKKMCGDLLPDINPCDALALKVLAAARAQKAHQAGANQPAPSPAP